MGQHRSPQLDQRPLGYLLGFRMEPLVLLAMPWLKFKSELMFSSGLRISSRLILVPVPLRLFVEQLTSSFDRDMVNLMI